MASHGGFIYNSVKWVKKTLDTYGFTDAFIVLTLFLFVLMGLSDPAIFFRTFAFVLALSPIVLPFLLWPLFKHSWMTYIHEDKYWNGREYCVLEVKLPEEILQSPFAMELVLRSMYDVGGIDTPIDEYWKGNTLPWYSLEIVSTGGVVKFYIWCFANFKDFIQSQIYAHYPQVQVHEVPDYTLAVPFDPYSDAVDVWGIEMQLQKPDPYPIATYVKMELDKKDLKEEYKHDPLVSLLEFFGSLGPGEHGWMQIIIRAHTVCPYSMEKEHQLLNIQEWAEKEKENILEKTVVATEDRPNFARLSEADKTAINAMEEKYHKQVFDTGIRMIYLTEKGAPTNKKAGFPTTMRAFEHGSSGRGLNGFKPLFPIGPFDYPWQDYFGFRKRKKKKGFYEGYVRRQYFWSPFGKMWMALNVEELASIFHFPGKVAHTPTLQRMSSKRGEAPANLPI